MKDIDIQLLNAIKNNRIAELFIKRGYEIENLHVYLKDEEEYI